MSRQWSKHMFLVMLAVACGLVVSAQSSILGRKTKWTVAETQDWAAKNQKATWHGWLLYRGSDTAYHHFISRVVDEWVWFDIKRSELTLADERVYKKHHSSSEPMGYYYVDATKAFVKIKDE